MADQFQSPFTPAFDTPGTEGSGVTSRGGADLGEGGRKETENSVSGLPLQPDTYGLGSGDPGKGGTVPVPDLITPNRTL